MRGFVIGLFAVTLAGCGQADNIARDAEPFAAIEAREIVTALGTEPFWNIEITGEDAVYSSPEKPGGEPFVAARFAGNNGLGFSGELDGKRLILTVTPGKCSDGMSEREFPFTATLAHGDETLTGCAYTDQQGFAGDKAP